MAWKTCDMCDGATYSADNPFVEIRMPRPSDKREMCCTLAGHMQCCGGKRKLPDITRDGGMATPEQWQTWIESEEAVKAGFLWLT